MTLFVYSKIPELLDTLFLVLQVRRRTHIRCCILMMMMMMVMIETLGRDSGGHDVTAAKRVTCAERESMYTIRAGKAAGNLYICVQDTHERILTMTSLLNYVCRLISRRYGFGFPYIFFLAMNGQQRKKVIFLHWFHHTTVLLYCWHAFHHEIAPGIWFAAMNFGVHMIMYSYYFAMACRLRRVASMIAPIITVLQIAQMVVGSVVTVYSASLHASGYKCKVDQANYKLGLAMYLSYFALFCILFYSKYLSGAPRASSRKARSEAKGIDGKEANGNGTNATMVAAKREIDDFCTGAHRVARATDAGGFFHVRNDSITSPPGGSATTSPTSVLDASEKKAR